MAHDSAPECTPSPEDSDGSKRSEESQTRPQPREPADSHEKDGEADATADLEADHAREAATAQAPWSIYSGRQKKMLILTASVASLFSPLSGQIYFPALNTIAADLRVSSSLVNLTITTYLLMQGLAPSFIGTLSDDAGRRLSYIVTFAIYSVANIGLALQNNYAALMVLRCVQSAGSSGTVALANAVVADLVTSAERGTYVSWTSVAPQIGPSVGPIIGGVLSQYTNWHFIFWFLLILAMAVFVPMLVFFPETCRKVVGDGSIPPPRWLKCYTNVIMERRAHNSGGDAPAEEQARPSKGRRVRFPNPLTTFALLFQKQLGFPLLLSGLVSSSYYAATAFIPSQFHATYGFNELQIALCYIPLGVGSVAAAIVRGPVIDSRFRYHAKRLNYPLKKDKNLDLTEFPIERARLEAAAPTLLAGSLFTIGFGWLVQAQVHLAAPLIFLFFMGFCVSATMNSVAVLIVDISPGNAGTVTAANNLLRCWLGAAATAAVVPMIDAIGIGWTTTIFGLLVLAASPGLWYIMKKGPGWRKEWRDRQQSKQPQ